jgi:hypothetical protein
MDATPKAVTAFFVAFSLERAERLSNPVRQRMCRAAPDD